MLNFFSSRFTVGHKCFTLAKTNVGLWRVLQEQIVVERVVIQTYHKSNFAVVTYECSGGILREEGTTEAGEEIPQMLFGSLIEAKAACAARNHVTFS